MIDDLMTVNNKYDGTFDKLEQSLNTKFVPTSSISESISATNPGDINKEIQYFEDKKKQIIEGSQSKIKTIEDKEWLQYEIKDLMSNGKLVLQKLQADLKIGCSPRMYEVYASLMNSVIMSQKELRELNKMVYDIELFQVDPNEGKSKTQVNINLTGKELLAMINNAKDNSQMNSVSTEFTIEKEKSMDMVDRKNDED
jgi:hypothetical protein